jgi:replicative DNA helicase
METNSTSKRNKSKVNFVPIELQGRMAPHARELEEAVLGAMMLERDKISEVSDVLSERHFYAPENKIIFNAIIHLTNQPNSVVDLLTVHNYLKSNNELELIGGSYYLAQLTNKVTSAANIGYHRRIRRRSG